MSVPIHRWFRIYDEFILVSNDSAWVRETFQFGLASVVIQMRIVSARQAETRTMRGRKSPPSQVGCPGTSSESMVKHSSQGLGKSPDLFFASFSHFLFFLSGDWEVHSHLPSEIS